MQGFATLSALPCSYVPDLLFTGIYVLQELLLLLLIDALTVLFAGTCKIGGHTPYLAATAHLAVGVHHPSGLCQSVQQSCQRPAHHVEDANLHRSPETVAGFLQWCELAAQLLHLVLKADVGLCCTVGCGLHVVARLRHLLTNDLSDGLGHVARFLHLLLDLRSG